MNSKQLGTLAENLASEILQKKGFKIINRNFYTKFGELDIVCKKNNIISFVEVKSISMHKNNIINEPKEQITKKKQFKLTSTANYFLLKNSLYNYDLKFDIVEIKFWDNKKYSFNHIENIF